MSVHLEDLILLNSTPKITLFCQEILACELTLKRPSHELKKLNQTLASLRKNLKTNE